MALARIQIAVGRGACLRVDVAVSVVVVGIRDGGGATGQQAASAKPIPGRRSGSGRSCSPVAGVVGVVRRDTVFGGAVQIAAHIIGVAGDL